MMIKRIFGFKYQNHLKNITLKNIEVKLYELGFTEVVVTDLMAILEKRYEQYGEQKFQEWFNGLHFRVPEEFKDEKFVTEFYQKHADFIEKQVKQLESETELSWEVQTEDIKQLNEKARKVQLVVRDSLSGIALELLD